MRYPPTRYQQVYINGVGAFLPGEPINNEQMDEFIAPVNAQSHRIKRRILAENGIRTRYYAIDKNGVAHYTSAQMGSLATQEALAHAGCHLDDVTVMAAGTSGGDVLMPGFANMLQGEMLAPPMEVRSHQGICAAGVAAIKDVANMLEADAHQRGIVTAVEFPSRLFKRTRYEASGYNIDFNAHFLRWMLSDGAGSMLLSRSSETRQPVSLKLEWIHMKSFSGDFPVCMQMGKAANNEELSFLDYPSFAAAEGAGAMALRQDIRLIPQLFDVGIHEYAELVRAGWITPGAVDHFLCHYSSERLGKVCEDLMAQAGLAIPRHKWYTNLTTHGNTGAASIFIMLAGLLKERTLIPGQKIFCFVPESGRFTVCYMMLTVVPARQSATQHDVSLPAAPHDPQSVGDPLMGSMLRDLAAVWNDYRSRAWRTPLVAAIRSGKFTREHYVRWMENWVPQVREGSIWMRNAVDHLSPPYAELAGIIRQHAGEEQNDFRILFEDYRAAGGKQPSLEELRRNAGGEALNAFLHRMAMGQDALGLLGAIYIIEGTGQRIIPSLLPLIREQLDLPDRCFRFLKYHGENDENHLARWLMAVQFALHAVPERANETCEAIVRTARHVAALYLMQWEGVE